MHKVHKYMGCTCVITWINKTYSQTHCQIFTKKFYWMQSPQRLINSAQTVLLQQNITSKYSSCSNVINVSTKNKQFIAPIFNAVSEANIFHGNNRKNVTSSNVHSKHVIYGSESHAVGGSLTQDDGLCCCTGVSSSHSQWLQIYFGDPFLIKYIQVLGHDESQTQLGLNDSKGT